MITKKGDKMIQVIEIGGVILGICIVMFFALEKKGDYTIKYNCHFNGCSRIHTDNYTEKGNCVTAENITVCGDYSIIKKETK